MQFNSLEYMMFLGVILILYYGGGKTFFYQRIVIVVASAIFYAFWSTAFLVHFVGIVTLNYWGSLWLERVATQRRKLTILWLLIGCDLANLVAFKYAGLAIDSANWFTTMVGVGVPPIVKPEIILPLAISFYTFHLISFLVDRYHGHSDSKPNSFLDFLFYVMLFPHQIAGPILRGHELFPQLGWKRATRENLRDGFERILIGLFQKAVIADNLAIIVDHGYKTYADIAPLELYAVSIAYSFQIFFDFAGYTNMGIGSAKLLGYSLPENFSVPYLASNISEFWRCWHMTLSRWVRDYIFIPLGGSKGSDLSTAVNLLVTMALAGLWHGASWTFMVWGAYHGLGLALHNVYIKTRLYQVLVAHVPGWAYRTTMVVVTFHFVTIGWILFRSPDFSTAWEIFRALAGLCSDLSGWRLAQAYLLKSYGFTTMALYGISLLVLRSSSLSSPFQRYKSVRLLAYALMLYLILLLAPAHTDPFIYFQF